MNDDLAVAATQGKMRNIPQSGSPFLVWSVCTYTMCPPSSDQTRPDVASGVKRSSLSSPGFSPKCPPREIGKHCRNKRIPSETIEKETTTASVPRKGRKRHDVKIPRWRDYPPGWEQ